MKILVNLESKNSVQSRAKLKSKEIPDECSLCVDAYGVGCSRKFEVLKKNVLTGSFFIIRQDEHRS